MLSCRHGRACPGHPRRAVALHVECFDSRRRVDGRRDKPGHDGVGSRELCSTSRPRRGLALTGRTLRVRLGTTSPLKSSAAPRSARLPANSSARRSAFPPARVSAALRAPWRARRRLGGVALGNAMDLIASIPGSKSEYSGARRASRARLTPALTNSSICAGTSCSRPNSLARTICTTSARQLVGDAEAVEIEVEDALLLVVGRIAHADMSVETSGALGQRLVDRLAMICRGDGDDVGVGTRPRTAPATARRSRRP